MTFINLKCFEDWGGIILNKDEKDGRTNSKTKQFSRGALSMEINYSRFCQNIIKLRNENEKFSIDLWTKAEVKHLLVGMHRCQFVCLDQELNAKS